MKTDILNNVGTKVTNIVGRTMLKAKKYSPEILIGVGIAGIITSTVMACKASRKLDDAIDEIGKDISEVKEKHSMIDKETGERVYDDISSDYRRDLTKAYFRSGVKIVRMYAPAVAIGTASIFCIIGSHNIEKKRNAAMAAAYSAIEEGYKKYRDRVISELGEDADKRFRYGIKEEEVEVVEEGKDGKKKTKKESQKVVDPYDNLSVYARYFDEACTPWTKDPETNLFFLRQQQRYANEMLQARGHVFLNEVYDMLDIPRTKEGAVVGWVKGNGDYRIDFGIYDLRKEANRRFVNGDERVILLDFNVDGLIYDLI